MKRSCLRFCCFLLCLILLAVPVSASSSETTSLIIKSWKNVFYEDHVNKTLAALKQGNDTVHTQAGKTPINNLYDSLIVGEGYTSFSTFEIGSKKLNLIGNHANETGSKNMFALDNGSTGASGKGLITLIPESRMQGLEEFTISWILRCHKPQDGYAGLCLFYDNMETVDSVDYFGGYDNYTYAGYYGYMMNDWSAYSVYGGKRTNFQNDALKTQRSASNMAIYASVHCTKGEYLIDGVQYTAKIESYSDDQHIATSYAMWADAPVMFYYENPASRWSVQLTNIKLDAAYPQTTTVESFLETEQSVAVTGTAVRYSGGAGLRFYTSLEKDALYENATDVKTGVILLEKSLYQGELTVDTAGILTNDLTRVESEDDAGRHEILDFVDPAIEGKIFYARAYAQYTVGGKTFYSYSPVELAGCSRTAAKVVSKYADSKDSAMLDACSAIAGKTTSVSAMSLNMLFAGDPKKIDIYNASVTWQQRLEAAVGMIEELSPDVIGLQEVITASQLQTLMAQASISSVYSVYGSADDRGTGGSGEEGMYLLYKRDKFEVVSQGVKYLSDSPDTQHSLFAEAREYNANPVNKSTFKPRKMVWVLLRHKETGREVAFATTHLAFSASDTQLDYDVRYKQALLATALLSGGTLFDADTPYLLMGDMNAKTNSREYDVFRTVMDDTRYIAYKTAPDTQGTYHSYVSLNSGTFIDHMFASRDDFCIGRFRIVTNGYKSESLGQFILPSDHYAIMSEVTVLPD